MKATINIKIPKKKELQLEVGHWYWVTQKGRTPVLTQCCVIDRDTYNIISSEQGTWWTYPAHSLGVLLKSMIEKEQVITPAKVTINAE